MWNINGEKEGFGILIDNEGNKYVGGWKEDKFNEIEMDRLKSQQAENIELIIKILEGPEKIISEKFLNILF